MYERFFGLADAPFRLTPDPRYLFLSAKHADALAHLRLGLSESSGFVCITGDVGTGKTTVLRHFLAELGPGVRTAYVTNPTLSALELLQTIAAEFGLPAAGSKKLLVDHLNRHLLAQREAGRTCIVVVDEAQALAVDVLEELRLLSNLETTTEKLLRIVLVGQPQLRALLQHPELLQLNQRITLRWHIGPLDRRETLAYVRHRVAVASDGQQPDLFSVPALRAIHGRAGGVPRLVNMLAHRALLAAFARGQRTVRRAAVRRACRELESIPLPARPAAARRLAWGTLGAGVAAAAVAMAIGGGFTALPVRPGGDASGDIEETQQTARLPRTPGPAPSQAGLVPDAELQPEARGEATRPDGGGAELRSALAVAALQPDPAPGAVGDEPAGGVTPTAGPVDAAVRTIAPADTAVEAVAPVDAANAPDANGVPPANGGAAAPPTTAPVPMAAPADAAPADAAPIPAAAPEAPTPEDALAALQARLGPLDETLSARRAVASVVAAWQLAPLILPESAAPADFAAIAERRGLEYLPLTANTAMLRLLDVPAVVQLDVPGVHGPRFATVLALDERAARLAVGDGEPLLVPLLALEDVWPGPAWVFWRDFEGLGPTMLEAPARGPRVARLQELLTRLGLYGGPGHGVFDRHTADAVLAFQRSRYIVADGVVGRLTRVVLYAATGGYPRPSLAQAEATS